MAPHRVWEAALRGPWGFQACLHLPEKQRRMRMEFCLGKCPKAEDAQGNSAITAAVYKGATVNQSFSTDTFLNF